MEILTVSELTFCLTARLTAKDMLQQGFDEAPQLGEFTPEVLTKCFSCNHYLFSFDYESHSSKWRGQRINHPLHFSVLRGCFYSLGPFQLVELIKSNREYSGNLNLTSMGNCLTHPALSLMSI